MIGRRLAIGGLTLVCILLAYFFFTRDTEADPYKELSSWPPNAAEIRREVAAGKDQSEAGRREQFAQMFQNRFRTHQPMYAIGLRFVKKGEEERIKLMCPARMEPWHMDRIAYAAWKESQEALGKAFSLDIYETYIGTPPIKIGELRSAPNSSTVHIAYLMPSAVSKTHLVRRGHAQVSRRRLSLPVPPANAQVTAKP